MSTVDPQAIPPLDDDQTAMMLGLVPDKRTPERRLLDAIDSDGASLNYRHEASTDDLIEREGDYGLFAPKSIQDVRERLARIESTGCPCVESDHLNALHDLAHDDVPVLLGVIETQDAENQTLRAAIKSIRDIAIGLGRPLHRMLGDILAVTNGIEAK